MRRCLAFFFILPAFCLTACITPQSAQYGVQAEQLARIPARIAVLPCRSWPQGALFVGQKALVVPPEDLTALCQKYDKYILEGFDGQPYMRGLSPKVVMKLLEQNKQPELLSQLDELWFRPGQACQKCQHPASYYSEVIAPRTDWRSWLTTLSRSVSQSDAILLPLVVEAGSGEMDDRGLAFFYRKAQLALLLIDTNNGELIWIGGRQGETRLPKASNALPDVAELYQSLFIPDLWLEFPGRQTN